MKVDFLIVGQGIAGTVLSYTLLKQGCSVLVLDREEENSSSKVAAGICNPITGKKQLKTWNADKLFPFLYNFYRDLEKELKVQFFFPKKVYRTFKDITSQNLWAERETSQLHVHVGRSCTT